MSFSNGNVWSRNSEVYFLCMLSALVQHLATKMHQNAVDICTSKSDFKATSMAHYDS